MATANSTTDDSTDTDHLVIHIIAAAAALMATIGILVFGYQYITGVVSAIDYFTYLLVFWAFFFAARE